MGQEYYTCSELMEKHPMAKLLNWNISKIGVFYSCLLLDGRRFGKNGRIMVLEPSFLLLIEYAKDCKIKADLNSDFLAYDEILEEYSLTQRLRWSPTIIGTFRQSGLLLGKRSKNESRYLITRKSVKDLLNYTSSRFNYK